MNEQKLARDRGGLSPRVRALLVAASTVVLAAAVLLGVSAFSDSGGDDGPATPRTLLSEETSEDLYDAAMEALASGDTTAAIELLQRALVVNPSDPVARQELDRLTRTVGEPAPDGAPGGGTDPADTPLADEPVPVVDPDAGFEEAVADIAMLLPDRVAGYELALPLALGADASITGDPVEGGPTATVARVLFAVHDRGSSAGADAFIRDVTRVAYPQDPTSVTVDGVPAYFGTDGMRFASVVYKRGRYVFEVIVTAVSGSPAALQGESVNAARAFPDTAP